MEKARGPGSIPGSRNFYPAKMGPRESKFPAVAFSRSENEASERIDVHSVASSFFGKKNQKTGYEKKLFNLSSPFQYGGEHSGAQRYNVSSP